MRIRSITRLQAYLSSAACLRNIPNAPCLSYARSLAGHSHWHNTRHRKARVDEARHALFTRLSLAITVAVRQQQQQQQDQKEQHAARRTPIRDGEFGPRLARAVEEARKHSLPRTRIEAALAGLVPDRLAHHDDALQLAANCKWFEAEFPGAIFLLVRVAGGEKGHATSRGTFQAIRGLFERAGGKAGKAAWMFDEEWTILLHHGTGEEGFEKRGVNVDRIVEIGVDAGATDFDVDEAAGSVRFCAPDRKRAAAVKQALAAEPTIDGNALHVSMYLKVKGERMVPHPEAVPKLLTLIDKLRERSDFLSVVHNAELPP
jgi:transcriptional/translational regulatory protein YebC/TACO1